MLSGPLRAGRYGASVVLLVLMAIGVVAVPVPALVLGAANLMRRSGRYSPDERTDRIGLAVIVTSRVLGLLLMAALSVVVLVSCVGGLLTDPDVPSLVYVFFVLDLLLAVLVLLTYGRGLPRPARRPASPAPR